ncbi:MAG: hypothetical protein N3A53_03755, partial [Verrucomicrobiae bacterium]|nr:hypothetical protein [Verrucomicrobiae bacterium]
HGRGRRVGIGGAGRAAGSVVGVHMRSKARIADVILALAPVGSKCDALVVEPDGTVVRRACASEPGRSGRSRAVVRAAIRRARQGLRYRHCQAAVLWPWGRREGIWFCRETEAALKLADVDWGVVALAGTGARVDAYTQGGRWLWLYGLGPVIGDAGSAYQIGRETLRAAARPIQHPRHVSSLKTPVLDYCEGIARHMHGKVEQGMLARLRAEETRRWLADSAAARLGWLIHFSLQPQDRSVIAGAGAVGG